MPSERFHFLYDHKGYCNWDVPVNSKAYFIVKAKRVKTGSQERK